MALAGEGGFRASIRGLMHRYRNRPMSLADACLVRMSELHPASQVFTLDSDFLIYRRHGNKVVPVLIPDRRATECPPRKN